MEAVNQKIAQSPHDYLVRIAAATLWLKAGNGAKASDHQREAEALRPGDPVVLLTAGNIAYYSGDIDKAQLYFSQCIKSFPELSAAFFNPCLYYSGKTKMLEGIGEIESASKRSLQRISDFIRTNDEYFSSDWPRIRHFMQASYTGSYFWWNVLPQYAGSWSSTNWLWGTRFLGIGAVESMICTAIIFFLLLVLSSRVRVQKENRCRLCDVVLCRTCTCAGVCNACRQMTSDIGDDDLRTHFQEKILRRRNKVRVIVRGSLDMLFPGAGTFASANAQAPKGMFFAMVMILLTAAVYASHAWMLTATFSYPLWVLQDIFAVCRWLLLCYSAYFAIVAGMQMRKRLLDGF
jgi:hypothetical protein